MADMKKEEESACGCGSGSCCSGPGKWILLVLALAVAGVLVAKNAGQHKEAAAGVSVAHTPATVVQPAAPAAGQTQALPRLVDLGATKCIPCKMMAPILEDLKKTYAGRLDVQFIDVWENPDAGKEYNINLIPTQIFYNAQGKELFRHEGFFAKQDILAKWKEFGVELPVAATNAASGGGA